MDAAHEALMSIHCQQQRALFSNTTYFLEALGDGPIDRNWLWILKLCHAVAGNSVSATATRVKDLAQRTRRRVATDHIFKSGLAPNVLKVLCDVVNHGYQVALRNDILSERVIVGKSDVMQQQ